MCARISSRITMVAVLQAIAACMYMNTYIYIRWLSFCYQVHVPQVLMWVELLGLQIA